MKASHNLLVAPYSTFWLLIKSKIQILKALMIFFCLSCFLPVYSQVSIYGLDEGKKAYINIYESSIFFGNDFYPDPERIARIPNGETLKLKIDSPQVLGIGTIPSSSRRYVFVTPNDSVGFKILPKENKKGEYFVRFYGKNAAHYNYLEQRDDSMGAVKFFRHHGGNLNEYKKWIADWKEKRIDFLRIFGEQYDISPEFRQWAKADIENEFVFLLFFPLYTGDVTFNDIPNDYFPEDVRVIENKASHYSIMAAKLYVLFHNESLFDKAPSKVYSDIVHTYSGELRSYLLSVMLGEYANKRDVTYLADFHETFEDSKEKIQNPIHLDYIEKGNDYISSLTNQFPDSVLSNTLLISFQDDKKISLKDFLKKHEGKSLYFDFWASWCAPCLNDIKDSKEVKNLLAKNEIEYIYISIDGKEADWRKSSETNNITTNQYLVLDYRNSPILDFLRINAIPEYVILDKNHIIRDSRSPKPIFENVEKIKKLIKDYDLSSIVK